MIGRLRKIVHPTDFSDGSHAALEEATRWARDHSSTLIVVHVCPHSASVEDVPSSNPSSPAPAAARLDGIVPTDTSVHCVHILLCGSPAEAIVKLAEDEQADLIVMGSHSSADSEHQGLGSVAASVNRNAHCPVVTVEPKATRTARSV